MNERLSKLEKYQRTLGRHWMYPVVTTLIGLIMMITIMVDYYRFNKIINVQNSQQ